MRIRYGGVKKLPPFYRQLQLEGCAALLTAAQVGGAGDVVFESGKKQHYISV